MTLTKKLIVRGGLTLLLTLIPMGIWATLIDPTGHYDPKENLPLRIAAMLLGGIGLAGVISFLIGVTLFTLKEAWSVSGEGTSRVISTTIPVPSVNLKVTREGLRFTDKTLWSFDRLRCVGVFPESAIQTTKGVQLIPQSWFWFSGFFAVFYFWEETQGDNGGLVWVKINTHRELKNLAGLPCVIFEDPRLKHSAHSPRPHLSTYYSG